MTKPVTYEASQIMHMQSRSTPLHYLHFPPYRIGIDVKKGGEVGVANGWSDPECEHEGPAPRVRFLAGLGSCGSVSENAQN